MSSYQGLEVTIDWLEFTVHDTTLKDVIDKFLNIPFAFIFLISSISFSILFLSYIIVFKYILSFIVVFWNTHKSVSTYYYYLLLISVESCFQIPYMY